MRNPKFLTFILLFSTYFLTAQNCSDTLYVIGKKCYQNGNKLTLQNLTKSMKTSDSVTQMLFRQYTDKYLGASALGFAGGFGIGFGVTSFLIPTSNANTTAQLAIFLTGLVCTGLSLSMEQSAIQKLQMSIESYNKDLRTKCTN